MQSLKLCGGVKGHVRPQYPKLSVFCHDDRILVGENVSDARSTVRICISLSEYRDTLTIVSQTRDDAIVLPFGQHCRSSPKNNANNSPPQVDSINASGWKQQDFAYGATAPAEVGE